VPAETEVEKLRAEIAAFLPQKGISEEEKKETPKKKGVTGTEKTPRRKEERKLGGR